MLMMSRGRERYYRIAIANETEWLLMICLILHIRAQHQETPRTPGEKYIQTFAIARARAGLVLQLVRPRYILRLHIVGLV